MKDNEIESKVKQCVKRAKSLKIRVKEEKEAETIRKEGLGKKK